MAPKRKRADGIPAAEASSSTRATRSSTRLETGTKAESEAMTSKLAPMKRSTTKAAAKPATAAVAETAPAKTSVYKQSPSEATVEVQSPAKKTKIKTTTTIKADSANSKPASVKGKPQGSSSRSTRIVPPTAVSSQEQNSSAAGRLKRDEPNSSNHVPDTKFVPTTAAATTAPATTTAITTTTSTPKGPIAKSRPQPQPSVKSEPYSAARALDLFQKYADDDNQDVIGPEGFEQLCTDAYIPLEGVLPLILAWQLSAKEMGKFTKDEWAKGTESLKISSLSQLAIALVDLENLLVLGKQQLKRPQSSGMGTASLKKKRTGDNEPYDRTAYWEYAADKKAAFQQLYVFCFVLAKPEPARNIDMETATAFWSVLLLPKYPLMGEVIEYINEKGSYKGTNKDLWSMMLEFCDTINPSLEDYEAEAAWPTLLDDFVAWKKSKVGNGNEENGNATDDS